MLLLRPSHILHLSPLRTLLPPPLSLNIHTHTHVRLHVQSSASCFIEEHGEMKNKYDFAKNLSGFKGGIEKGIIDFVTGIVFGAQRGKVILRLSLEMNK